MPDTPAQLIELADSIVVNLSEYDGFEYSEPLIVKRAYVPSLTVKDIASGDVYVQVVPLSRALSRLSREQILAEPVITIGVQCKCDKDDQDTLDQLMRLVEQITELLQKDEGINGSMTDGYDCTIVTNDPVFDAKSLMTDNMFFSLIRVSYQNEA